MNSPFRIPTKIRIAFSKLGSLLLLFQKTPLVQILLPEARVLGTSGVSEVVKWSVATIAGLGAFDTVAGATVISQVTPSPNSTTVPAKTGNNLTFLVQVTGAPSSKAGSWQVVGTLPPGLVHANKVNSSTDSITGIPTATGSYPITIKAWEDSGYRGGAKSQAFTIVVTDGGGGTVTTPAITSQPASITINSGGTTTLSVAASGTTPTFQWYRGSSGTTTSPISGATSANFTTPALTATTSYWVRASNSAGAANSNAATVTVITPPAITTQPVSTTINSGGSTTLTVAASGTSPTFQWYRGASGNTTNPVSGATSASFTTPALTANSSYWARATNGAGTSDSNAATITITINPPEPGGAGPFKVGEPVIIDLDSLTNAGETLKLVGKLPKGLKLNLATGQITGTVTGLAGTYPIKFNVLQGKTPLRTIDFPIVIAGSVFFTGQYDALLESTAGIPAGAFKLLFKKGNAWSATLESPGTKARKATGKLTVSQGATTTSLIATFPASGSAPAVTINATLDLESAIVSGTYNGGTVRGFRLAGDDELPAAGKALCLVFEAGVHDGLTAPAGIGWANGIIGTSGTATFSGMLGDGTAVKLPVRLSATGQALLWSQPYSNSSSYFGGIVTLPDLGQNPAADVPLTDKVGWFKGPDTKSLSYPAGFPAMEVTVGSSTWTVPATASVLGASLGWLNNSSPVVEIDGAGLSNATPQSTNPTLPTGFTLDASFNLTAPSSLAVAPWTGKVSAANGTFTGSLTLPAAFVPDGIAGPAATSGVLLQADAWGSVTGCGLIKILVAGGKGSFRTSAIILKQ
jgi:hypothetical protein